MYLYPSSLAAYSHQLDLVLLVFQLSQSGTLCLYLISKEEFFICFLATWISSFVKFLFKSVPAPLPSFVNWSLCLFIAI